MKKYTIIIAALFCWILFNSNTNTIANTQLTKDFCIKNIAEFIVQIDSFQSICIDYENKKTTQQQVIYSFKNTRIKFKKFEFILEYLDAKRYKFFNGVNAIDNDEGNKNAEPEGLQVIENLIFEDSIDIKKVQNLVRILRYRTQSFLYFFKAVDLTDKYIFEAIKYQLIRIETLGITSFDSPNLKNNVAEIIVSLQSLEIIMQNYSNNSNFEKQKNAIKLATSIKQSIFYLKNKNFNNLDRLFFIKKHVQPMHQNLLALHSFENSNYWTALNQYFRPVNLAFKSIYDSNFINTKYFANDQFYAPNNYTTSLGKKLFFDKQLSFNNKMSCATCHQPNQFFADGLPTAITNKNGIFNKRNTPTLIGIASQSFYMYDFAAFSLETQVGHVIHNTLEFNTTYDTIIQKLQQDTSYINLFKKAFPEYKITQIAENTINICLATFIRTLETNNTIFDKYMRNEIADLQPNIKRGFNLFMGKAQCGTCHFAPTFFGNVPPFYQETESEVLGVPIVWDTLQPKLDTDIGRFKFFTIDMYKNSFKTSTVRNIAKTSPYFHNGAFSKLEDVVEFYNKGGGSGIGLDIPNQTLSNKKLHLTTQEKKDIIAFMNALTDNNYITKQTK